MRFLPKILADRFEIRARIGVGGMATVFRAWDRVDRVERAVKVLDPECASFEKGRARFILEAETMLSLDHPNITRVRFAGRDGTFEFFAMTLARGSLSGQARLRGPLPVLQVIAFGWQALQGLAYAHGRGVVHRDVKPPNLLIGPRGTIQLADFGVARVVTADEAARLTGSGDLVGTLSYMAPEQRLDPRRADTRCDIYGLGASLYFLSTGRRPLELALAEMDPRVVEAIPAPLRRVIRRSTSYAPEERYASADEMSAALVEAWASLSEPRSGLETLTVEEGPRNEPENAEVPSSS
jgi:serine/threonine-protein kinase